MLNSVITLVDNINKLIALVDKLRTENNKLRLDLIRIHNKLQDIDANESEDDININDLMCEYDDGYDADDLCNKIDHIKKSTDESRISIIIEDKYWNAINNVCDNCDTQKIFSKCASMRCGEVKKLIHECVHEVISERPYKDEKMPSNDKFMACKMIINKTSHCIKNLKLDWYIHDRGINAICKCHHVDIEEYKNYIYNYFCDHCNDPTYMLDDLYIKLDRATIECFSSKSNIIK